MVTKWGGASSERSIIDHYRTLFIFTEKLTAFERRRHNKQAE
jgi:hypothetical protein